MLFNAHMTHPVIHCFVDASKNACGVIVCFILDNQVSFVTAMTCVAPLETLTILQLELMVAMVITRLTKFVLL